MVEMRRETRVLVVDPHMPDPQAIADAAAVLRAGRLVGLPTETVYGLGARALDAEALARIFRAKGRPSSHPVIVHVLNATQARALAAVWPEDAGRLAEELWPGPLTLVVERGPVVPAAVAGGGPSVAVRAPSHPVARAVIEALGEPIAAPSANRYQGLSPTQASHVVKQLGGRVDLVLDAGPCEAGIESTVVDVRAAPARVLRPGAVSMASLRKVLPDVEAAAEHLRGGDVRASPGMQDRHYAPRARLVLAKTRGEAVEMAARLAAKRERVGLVLRGATAFGGAGSVVRVMPADPESYARRLYGVLHELDDAGATAIVVERVPESEAWSAVADRLERGAAV